MRPSLLGISLSVLLSLAGCDSIFGSDDAVLDVHLVTDQAVYEPGALVLVTLHNRTFRRLETSMCPLMLDTREEGGWQPTPYGGQLCPLVIEVVEARDSLKGIIPLPSELPAGEYRARTFVSRPDDDERQDVTAVFRVAS